MTFISKSKEHVSIHTHTHTRNSFLSTIAFTFCCCREVEPQSATLLYLFFLTESFSDQGKKRPPEQEGTEEVDLSKQS